VALLRPGSAQTVPGQPWSWHFPAAGCAALSQRQLSAHSDCVPRTWWWGIS